MAAMGIVHGSSLQILQCQAAGLAFDLARGIALAFGVSAGPGIVSSASEESGAATGKQHQKGRPRLVGPHPSLPTVAGCFNDELDRDMLLDGGTGVAGACDRTGESTGVGTLGVGCLLRLGRTGGET